MMQRNIRKTVLNKNEDGTYCCLLLDTLIRPRVPESYSIASLFEFIKKHQGIRGYVGEFLERVRINHEDILRPGKDSLNEDMAQVCLNVTNVRIKTVTVHDLYTSIRDPNHISMMSLYLFENKEVKIRDDNELTFQNTDQEFQCLIGDVSINRHTEYGISKADEIERLLNQEQTDCHSFFIPRVLHTTEGKVVNVLGFDFVSVKM